MTFSSLATATWKNLAQGNRRYVDQRRSQMQETRPYPQHAKRRVIATVITCSDCKYGAESLFSLEPGELFNIQSPASLVGEAELASVQYAHDQLGVGLIVVLAHGPCRVFDDMLELDRSEMGVLSFEVHTTHAQACLATTKAQLDSTSNPVARTHALRMAHSIRMGLPEHVHSSIIAATVDDSTGKVSVVAKGATTDPWRMEYWP